MNVCEGEQVQGSRRQLTIGVGLLSNTFSIFSITSGVNLGKTSIAPKFSINCSGLVAPRMTVLVYGLTLVTHASASCATLHFRSANPELITGHVPEGCFGLFTRLVRRSWPTP
jgi:hypothetical protein